MMNLFSLVLFAVTVLVAFPVGVLLLETMAALFLPQPELPVPPQMNAVGPVAVLVPAHNESSHLLPTLADIKHQLRACDRLLVVADNCTDDTADVARAAGASVVVRDDPTRRGKGYSLDFGIRALRKEPPDVVVIIDADCRVDFQAIGRLAAACALKHRPIQALDLMTAPDDSTVNFKVAEFAWRLKNWIRPLGLRALGLPCQLMGTGMAFPWALISSANLAHSLTTEDLQLGLDFALAGSPPIFWPFPAVTSQFPTTAKAAQGQRRRWEQGHIRAIGALVPKLILQALLHGDLKALALTVDAAIPPLSLLFMLLLAVGLLAGLAAVFGASLLPAKIAFLSLVALSLGVLGPWLKYGRDVLQPRSAGLILWYLIAKTPLYLEVLVRNFTTEWIRTDRGKR